VRATRGWSAIFEQQRNISAQQNLNLSIGVAYEDDCSFFSIAYVRQGVNDRQLGPSESIQFQFVFTGLGGTGSNSFD
jgi:LPS-assembly protein